ncbi:hypothetical protein HJG60_008660 [Phyllostomus discolor]|uniref:Uncharacterized protein n=1 Tax=Phyllostomus discolor TaxID=89673 RepID=A0A833Z1F6_9CHIR|nr:hypothetical protein HJG60_008660 [Phyllostomus discolor]
MNKEGPLAPRRAQPGVETSDDREHSSDLGGQSQCGGMGRPRMHGTIGARNPPEACLGKDHPCVFTLCLPFPAEVFAAGTSFPPHQGVGLWVGRDPDNWPFYRLLGNEQLPLDQTEKTVPCPASLGLELAPLQMGL